MWENALYAQSWFWLVLGRLGFSFKFAGGLGARRARADPAPFTQISVGPGQTRT
jgi:hypothetical protein